MAEVEVLTGEIVDPLDDAEYAELERLETTISSGLTAFIDVGNALAEIKEKRLYRQYHSSFDAYCRNQWDMGKSKAYALIQAAALTEELSGIPDTPLPANPAQAEALAPLAGDPEAAAAAMQAASADGPATAKKIADEAEKRAPKPGPSEPDFAAPDESEDPGLALQREQAASRRQAVAEKATKYVNDLLLLDVALIDPRTVGRVERWCVSVREAQEAAQ
jgi:hypothetical protein